MSKNFQLPYKHTDVDWDSIVPHYENLIFSPFAREMTKDSANRISRKLLLNRLKTIPLEQSMQMHVADYGCGPGNLLLHVEAIFSQITGVERNKKSLAMAESLSHSLSINFNLEKSVGHGLFTKP